MKLHVQHSVLLALALLALSSAFLAPTYTTTPSSSCQQRRREGVITAGLFDGFNAERARQKEEDYQKQQEILRARQDEGKQRQYFSEVNKRRAEVSKNINEKFNLAKGKDGKTQDPAIKWMELRKQGKIKDREKYEGYEETNRGIVIPQVPIGNAKYDQGERFDLRLPYVDDGYVDPEASLGNTIKRLFGFGKERKPTTLPKGPGSDGPGSTSGKGKKK